MLIKGGVGWTMPRVIVSVVNAFLSIFNARPIPDHSGIYSPWKSLFPRQVSRSDSAVCGPPPA
jgi:hypothetical protein